jgi:N-acetylmuramoyl-L-alanine amidase
VVSRPTATPAPESRVQLVLVVEADNDMAGASETFDAIRRRGIRTLSFVSPEAHPDFARLSIADGHLPGVYIQAGQDPAAEAAAWEALLTRIQGLITYRLALADDESAAGILEGRGYTVVRAGEQVDGQAGQIVRLSMGKGGAQQLANLSHAAAGNGLGLGSHILAEQANASPFVRPQPAADMDEFKARYLIVLDPGHTRVDNGTPIYPPVGKPVLERWSVLQRANAWKKLLDAEGWTSVLTHDDSSLFDDYKQAPDTVNDGQRSRRDDLQYRADLCYYLGVRTGRTPVVISLHVDSQENKAKVGPLTFYAAHGDPSLLPQGKRLAEFIHDQLVQFWVNQGIEVPGRGVLHSDTFAWDRAAEAGYTLIGNRFLLPAPGTELLPTDVYIGVLIEAGMATHPEEAQIVATVEGNVLLAQAHHVAFQKWVEWMLASAQPAGGSG